MVDRKLLRLSAVLSLFGVLFFNIVTILFHPRGVADNDHPAVFAQYAQSAPWTAVHLGQFLGTAVLIVGLVVLLYALNLQRGTAALAATVIGTLSAGTALALSAVAYAVDGVTLKRAVDAWMSAPDSEKAARFASAEAIRWLEEATKGYQSFLLGLTMLLLAALIIWKAGVPRVIGYLLGLTAVANLVTGWITGVVGFAPEIAIPATTGQVSPLLWSVWLLVVAWRMPELDQAVISPSAYD